jgi:peptidylamidoglycolate lyase
MVYRQLLVKRTSVIVMFQKNLLAFYFVILIALGSCNYSRQDQHNLFRYQLVKDWLALPDSFILGNPTGIGIDTYQNVFVFHRADRKWPLIGSMPSSYISSKTILQLDGRNGQLINSWGDNFFIMPHGLTVDDNNNIWVTDAGRHQVFKFSHDGKLLLTLGEARVPGNDSTHFNRPTDVAVTKDGSFYVSDGYRNSRIVKFSSSGHYLFQWGTKGNDESEFDIPHGICLDTKGNVYVADRENKRVQVFDAAGKLLEQWTHKGFGGVCSVAFNRLTGNIVAVDDATSWFKLKHKGSDLIFFDSAGNVSARLGRSGAYTGPRCWYHDVAVDAKGNVYTGDILGNQIQKFVPAGTAGSTDRSRQE